MKKIITILVLLFILDSCNQPSQATSNNIIESGEKVIYKVEKYQYDSLTIPRFFKKLVINHIKDFVILDSLIFNEFCLANKINSVDSSNIEKFYTIKILHELFTSQTASDCSKGKILNIPYMWHWTQPNPRHEIYFVQNKTLLKDTRPPNGFSRYNSYADIDRTPYLFLSDLVSPELKYYSNSCDTFSTFGWCSEREMAFIALTTLLDYEGKVVAEGNHSWSEFVLLLKLNTGELQYFKVTVDNTFNSIDWTTIRQQEISEWKENIGGSRLPRWYNQKAKSINELNKISNHLVSNNAMKRIENKLVIYLDREINRR
jgi:hypothetical protein